MTAVVVAEGQNRPAGVLVDFQQGPLMRIWEVSYSDFARLSVGMPAASASECSVDE